eukprot:43212_1
MSICNYSVHWNHLFDMAVIIPSIWSTITILCTICSLLRHEQYFFGVLSLSFILLTQGIYLIIFHPHTKYLLLTVFIAPFLPLLYYVQKTQSIVCDTVNETTPLNTTNTYDPIPRVIQWKKSRIRSLYLFLIQAIFESLPCISLQVFVLFTQTYSNDTQLFILHFSIGSVLVSLIPKSLLLCSEMIPLFYAFRWLCIVSDTLLILLILSCINALISPIGYLILAKALVFTVPLVISLMIKNYSHIHIQPPCAFAVQSIDTLPLFLHYILKMVFIIIDIVFITCYLLGILLLSIFVFEVSNFQLLYWFSITYLHGRFLDKVSKLNKLIPFNFILNHQAKHPHVPTSAVFTRFISNPTANNISLFSSRYVTSCTSCIPNQLFWQILFEWILKYTNQNDLLYRVVSANYVLLKYSKGKYDHTMFHKWLLCTHKFEICKDTPTIKLSHVKDICLTCMLSKQYKATLWSRIKHDLFGRESTLGMNACAVLYAYIQSWGKGIFALIILPLYIISRVINVIILPILLMLVICHAAPINIQRRTMISYDEIDVFEWVFRYMDIRQMIDWNTNFDLQNMNVLQRIIYTLYFIFIVMFICNGCCAMYYEWILSFCVPGITQTSENNSKRNEFIVLRYMQLQDRMFAQIVELYRDLNRIVGVRNVLSLCIPDTIAWIILSFL